ncbi:MAG TPA: hypothetical protein VFT19_11875 [Solirubrobacterales bacterium]|nr:hypothetical protein [Solirubrobacterales bacterium]
MLERWNDDKMDALDAKVGRLEVGLARTDAKVDRIEADVAKLDTKLDEHRKEAKTAFEKVNDRLLYGLMAIIGAGATIAGAVLAAPHL